MVVDQLEFVLNVSAPRKEANPSKGGSNISMPVREQASSELTGWDGTQEVRFELLDISSNWYY